MAELTDSELMIRFQQGNVHAFELLFEKYRVPVFNFIYRMLNREKAAAEDLLQEVFVKLHRGKDFYEPRGKFSTWLFAITRNHCLNFIKSKRYEQGARTVSIDARREEIEAPGAGEASGKGVALWEVLEESICALPDEYKDAFLLHAVEGFTHDEVGEVLKINPATAKTRYHRARMLLRKWLAPVFARRDGQKTDGDTP